MGEVKRPKISRDIRVPGKQIDIGTHFLCLCVNLAGKIHQAQGYDELEAGGQFSKHANGAEQEQRNLRITFFNREGQGIFEEECLG